MSKLIDIIAGARPNFMKIAPILAELDRRKREGGSLEYRLIHTGQHYDKNMSGAFFEQLGIPEPDVNFGVGGGSQAEQTGAIMVAYEKLLMEKKSDLCLVVFAFLALFAVGCFGLWLGFFKPRMSRMGMDDSDAWWYEVNESG